MENLYSSCPSPPVAFADNIISFPKLWGLSTFELKSFTSSLLPLYSPNDIIPNCFSPKYFVISTTTIWKLSYCLSLCASILNSKSYALFFSIPLITYVFSFSVITDVFGIVIAIKKYIKKWYTFF